MAALARNEGSKMNGKAKKFRKKLICAGISILFITASAKEARAELIFENILVTTEPGEQVCPDVWGNYIVWGGAVNQAYDIQQRKIVEMPGLNIEYEPYPAICDNKVVWKGGNGYYDLDSKQMVSLDGLSIGNGPAIHSNKIVWGDSTGYYDIELQQMVYPEGLTIGLYPTIQNNKIIWYNSTGYYDIDLQKMVYLEGLDIGWYPAIYNNKIVWFVSIGYYDIDLQQMVYPEGLYVDAEPDIFEDNIVWGEGGVPGPPANIFMWDPVNGTRNITERGVSFNPKIYNDIVVWMDLRNGNWDVYMAVVPEPATVLLFGAGLAFLISQR